MALRSLLIEGFRGIRSAELTFETVTTILLGENDCGKSSLLEALSLVLSPSGGDRPQLHPRHFHRAARAGNDASSPLRIELGFVESRTGSWDRLELAELAPVLGSRTNRPRSLVVELTARPGGSGVVEAHWELKSPGGLPSRDDPAALAALRRMNPFVWLRRNALVRTNADGSPDGSPRVVHEGAPSDAVEILRSYDRFLAGATSEEREIEAGYEAAERLLAQWAPGAHSRQTGARAPVAEILGRALEPAAAPRGSKASSRGAMARKLGVFLLTARLFEHLRDAAPGVRPIIVIEEPEAGLHPMTLASVWGLLERLNTQKIVSTQSGTVLSAAPLRSLRRLVRGANGVVREWRVHRGEFAKEELRKVSYHLRTRRGVACFARCWLLVEGETEYWILPDLGRLASHDLAQEGVACVEFAQCGLAPLVKLARALGIDWHVITDGDRAGEAYARTARSFLDGEEPQRRITQLDEPDIEHCFWRHGYAGVFERLSGLRARPGTPPRRLIQKAVDRHSKPGVAFELLAAVAAPGSPGPPPPLRRTLETCIALARDNVTREPATGRDRTRVAERAGIRPGGDKP